MKKKVRFPIFCLLTCAVTLMICLLGSRTVTVMAENIPPERNTRILLDPGHGGVDGGAVSCTGVSESQVNLEIALRLRSVFQLLGYETHMVRESDISVYTKGETIAQKKVSDLKHRVQIVNDLENALLLSIHQNHFTDGRYSGPQVFYAKTTGSQALAEKLQDKLNAALSPGSSRRAQKTSGVYLMEHIQRPGVLIECGFLSNSREEALLRTPNYQKKVSAVIACSVAEYLSNT